MLSAGEVDAEDRRDEHEHELDAQKKPRKQPFSAEGRTPPEDNRRFEPRNVERRIQSSGQAHDGDQTDREQPEAGLAEWNSARVIVDEQFIELRDE